jgi:hypothetical protein
MEKPTPTAQPVTTTARADAIPDGRSMLVPTTPSVPSGGQPALPSPSAGLPAELAKLDAQFRQFRKERVTQPFEKEVEVLNKYYLGGIERAIAAERAAGRLDGILALEAEQRTVSSGAVPQAAGSQRATSVSAVPEIDDEKVPASLKALRNTYRARFAPLVADREKKLKDLTEPLDKHLANLEIELTKANRVPDAKAVRMYREALAQTGVSDKLTNAGVSGERFTNSLGMKFVPVAGTDVLFCIHETRRQDYQTYASEFAGLNNVWKTMQRNGIPCGDKDGHPVVGVSWEDAVNFCEWLSKKEGKTYRLPTDEEWSIAVGLGQKEQRGSGITPEMLSQKETTEFPWGNDYSLLSNGKVGNYADAAWTEKFPAIPGMKNFTDGYPTTAPVMSFNPNELGLYDMGGNVWEWVEDWWNETKRDRVLRGGAFCNSSRPDLLSSGRAHPMPGSRGDFYGFRIVLAKSAAATAALNLLVPKPLFPNADEPMDNGSQDRIRDTQDLHFSWSAVQGATKYEIHAWRVGASRPIVQMEVSETELKQSKIGYVALANCKDWRWKVRAFTQNQWQAWCEDVSFEFEPPDQD